MIEMAPVREAADRHAAWSPKAPSAAAGPGGSRIFRYEVRRWAGGAIPDVDEAVDSPRQVTRDADLARHLLDLVKEVPTPVWGRDELRSGERWNSNSLTAWLIARSGLDASSIHPPAGGRAPGWGAGLAVAARP